MITDHKYINFIKLVLLLFLSQKTIFVILKSFLDIIRVIKYIFYQININIQ